MATAQEGRLGAVRGHNPLSIVTQDYGVPSTGKNENEVPKISYFAGQVFDALEHESVERRLPSKSSHPQLAARSVLAEYEPTLVSGNTSYVCGRSHMSQRL